MMYRKSHKRGVFTNSGTSTNILQDEKGDSLNAEFLPDGNSPMTQKTNL